MREISVSRDVSTATSTTSPRVRTPARRRTAVRRSGVASAGTPLIPGHGTVRRQDHDPHHPRGDTREDPTQSLRQTLAAGRVATIIGGTNDPDLFDQLGTLDVDGIWLEGEHGGVDYADLGNLTRACDLWGKTSVVRVMDNDYATIYRTLDRGAQAIVVPHVNTRAEAQAVVEAGKFAPLGKRGMFTSRQGFGVDDYFKTANDQSMLMVLIEDIAAIPRLDEILKVDHIDVFFVAPSDLATSMGHIGNVGHPDVQRT